MLEKFLLGYVIACLLIGLILDIAWFIISASDAEYYDIPKSIIKKLWLFVVNFVMLALTWPILLVGYIAMLLDDYHRRNRKDD